MQTPDLGEQPNRIQVVARVRPVLPHELADDVAVSCSSDSRRLQVLLPDRLSGGTSVLPGATRTGARSYEFDACLAGNTTQEELYDVCGLQELVEAALDGYCVTVFAFGQTGSGKTHTIIGPRLSRGAAPTAGGGGAAAASNAGRLGSMSAAHGGGGGGDDYLTPPGSSGSARSGSGGVPAGAMGHGGGGGGGGGGGILVDPEDGILTRCIAHAFRAIEARSGSAEFAVTASVVELYNEAVTDLLALDKTKTLQVRKDTRDGFAVTGLTQVTCPSDLSAVRYMVRALQYRHTRGHKLNEYSSRSHCLMTFVFASKEAGPDGQMGAKGGIRRYGKLVLVDLAGSERLKDTGNSERGAVRETGAINKSLFTLGQVLGGLSARSTGSATAFVPFRDSKLTQLLWDGLRGSGRCLMLACVGPMRSAVEESLNTLHFATMATRIKAEPVVLLDPQDQLVLDLRKTILQLREENRQLAGALQQLSSGADPSSILSALPDTLRSQAASSPSPDGRPGGSPHLPGSPGDSSPVTPLRPLQHHLQPLSQPAGPGPGPAGRARQPSYDTGPGGSPERLMAQGSGGYGGGGGGYAPSPHAQQGGQRAVGLDVRSSYGSSVAGYGGVGGASGGQHRPSGGMAVELPSPSPGPVPGGPGSRGKQQQQKQRASGGAGGGRTPSPLHTMYGMSPSRSSPSSSKGQGQGRNGRKTGGGQAKGSSPRDGNRSRSVGRGGPGGRPTYLTEDPGALLFGYSNALQPPPGSGSSSTTTLPALGPGRGAAAADRGLAPPPPPVMSDFPELAALEAEFQNLVANGGGGARGSIGAGGGGGGGARAGSGSAGAAGPEADDAEGARPDVRALRWAERNAWFGTDYDMTAFAYQVHDRLVDVEHVDPTSDLYYAEIERLVSEKFPDKWARAMRDQLPGGSGAAAAANIRRASGGNPNPPPPPSYSAALRVHVKDPVGLTRSPGSGGADNATVAAQLAAQAAQAAARARQQQQQQYGGGPASYDSGGPYEYGELQLSSVSQPTTPLYDNGGGGDATTPPMMGVNPFNIGALHSEAPPKASKFAPVPGGGHGMVLVPAGQEPLGRNNPLEVYSDPNTVERIQKEYARQRALVVEELRQAKEDAEAERQRILNRIQRAAGGNKWRS